MLPFEKILFFHTDHTPEPYVDQDDMENGTKKRLKKDSFYWYQKAIQTNGEDLG